MGLAGAIARFWQRVYRAFCGEPTDSELARRVVRLERQFDALERKLEARDGPEK